MSSMCVRRPNPTRCHQYNNYDLKALAIFIIDCVADFTASIEFRLEHPDGASWVAIEREDDIRMAHTVKDGNYVVYLGGVDFKVYTAQEFDQEYKLCTMEGTK